MGLDILIRNGRIIDGSGNPSVWGDVGIKDGTIAAVGRLDGATASQEIDARGRVVSPGFIDPHTHSDLSFVIDPAAQSKIRQGVTVEVTGNCGSSAGGPLKGTALERFAQGFERYGITPAEAGATWVDIAGYLDAMRNKGGTTNTVALVGHGTLRACVLGYEDRAPTPPELQEMKRLLEEGLEQGAMGMSTGLFYVPGSYAKTEEVAELVRIVARHDKLYASHIRDEGYDNVGYEFAWNEVIETGKQSGARVLVNHIKCLGPKVWGHAERIIGFLETARRDGVNIVADQYPYAACGGGITGLLMPRWAQEGGRQAMIARFDDAAAGPRLRWELAQSLEDVGGPDKLQIRTFAPQPEIEGLRLSEVCGRAGAKPVDQILAMARQGNASFISHILSETDMLAFARHPAVTVGSDGTSLSTTGPLSAGHPHPRDFGTFPRAIRLFVREHKLYCLEESIRKLTSMAAQIIGLQKRGLLRAGYWADVIVFDPEGIADTNSWLQPKTYSAGIDWAIVNGAAVIADGEFTGRTPGRPLTGKHD